MLAVNNILTIVKTHEFFYVCIQTTWYMLSTRVLFARNELKHIYSNGTFRGKVRSQINETDRWL